MHNGNILYQSVSFCANSLEDQSQLQNYCDLDNYLIDLISRMQVRIDLADVHA